MELGPEASAWLLKMDAESRDAEARPSMALQMVQQLRLWLPYHHQLYSYNTLWSSLRYSLLIFRPSYITTANISFLRRFFASSVNPATMSAAKTKAQKIIDENAVGTNTRCLENLNGS